MIFVHLPIELDPDVLAVLHTRLAHHLFGRAKSGGARLGVPSKAGSALPRAPEAQASLPEPAAEADADESLIRLDQAQRHALQAFRDGKLPGEQPNVTLRRIFDLTKLGLVEKVQGRYYLTPLGFTVWVAQS